MYVYNKSAPSVCKTPILPDYFMISFVIKNSYKLEKIRSINKVTSLNQSAKYCNDQIVLELINYCNPVFYLVYNKIM